MDATNKSSESLLRRPELQEEERRDSLSHMLSQPPLGIRTVTSSQDRLPAFQTRQRLVQILDQALAIADSADLNAVLSELEADHDQVQEEVPEGSPSASSNVSQ